MAADDSTTVLDKHCLLRATSGRVRVVEDVVLKIHHEAPFIVSLAILGTQALLIIVELAVETLTDLSAQQLVSSGQVVSSPSVHGAGSV